MNRWKIIRIIAISILCMVILYCFYNAFKVYNRNTQYPYEAFGAVIVNNWVDELFLEIILLLHILGVPVIIDIILIIISTIKIKQHDK